MSNIEQLNSGVRSWAGQTLQSIKNKYMSVVTGSKRSGDGLDSLNSKTKKNFGEISQITFGFNRYLVWLIKGAGKGQGGTKGSSWVNQKGVRVSTNSKSLNKMNTGNRHEKDFINPIVANELPKLADIVANFKADQVVKAIQIK